MHWPDFELSQILQNVNLARLIVTRVGRESKITRLANFAGYFSAVLAKVVSVSTLITVSKSARLCVDLKPKVTKGNYDTNSSWNPPLIISMDHSGICDCFQRLPSIGS